ncbi:hypothetical protein [Pseudomonas sp. GM17]|uniref:hypothetical protein n=1 Tax=Pseudomonas sp. GM17 TaxID=1144323 RepID=UPI0012F6664A|nr:hypothetical protein [Pseudomonas sp. GM17]WIE49843.1 hypothetical protein PMI20_029785 [Pseudomonas sp. GM17]
MSTPYAVHPGMIGTEVWRTLPRPLHWLLKFLLKIPKEGAKVILHCATTNQLTGESGLYYENDKQIKPSTVAEFMNSQHSSGNLAKAAQLNKAPSINS